jgi:DNA polymerase elongation subunit (family B)
MLILDCEVYSNYFLLAIKQVGCRAIQHFEIYPGHPLDEGVSRTLNSGVSVGFNSANYDLPIISAALRGASNEKLKALSDSIISEGTPWWKLGIKIPKTWDHIDIIQLAIGQSSLKIYGGRIHAPRLQDLPIAPDASITPAQRELLRNYCENDLDLTERLYQHLYPQIELRKSMSKQYENDLRSKSDAQIAEIVIRHEIERLGEDVSKPLVKPGATFRYIDPGFISFQASELKNLFCEILEFDFALTSTGSIEVPDWLKKTQLTVGDSRYQIGVGGLHSCEKRQFVEPSRHEFLLDMDVVSYYPSVILGQRLAPAHLGESFLTAFKSLVDRRIDAKRKGMKVEADALKITINGAFGKFGSKYSFLYSPGLLLQTTMTGQLALLMLIEQMYSLGIKTVSANTDGIVLFGPRALMRASEEVAWAWMLSTGYELENTEYRQLASRDVNNYFAIKTNGEIKGKGVFAAPSLGKNPNHQIVYTAVVNKILNGASVEKTIRECADVCQFVTVRRVTGGATWGNVKIGKVVRHYYSVNVPKTESIVYTKNGNKVPDSQGSRPALVLPATFPADVDYDVYEVAANNLLKDVGYA